MAITSNLDMASDGGVAAGSGLPRPASEEGGSESAGKKLAGSFAAVGTTREGSTLSGRKEARLPAEARDFRSHWEGFVGAIGQGTGTSAHDDFDSGPDTVVNPAETPSSIVTLPSNQAGTAPEVNATTNSVAQRMGDFNWISINSPAKAASAAVHPSPLAEGQNAGPAGGAEADESGHTNTRVSSGSKHEGNGSRKGISGSALISDGSLSAAIALLDRDPNAGLATARSASTAAAPDAFIDGGTVREKASTMEVPAAFQGGNSGRRGASTAPAMPEDPGARIGTSEIHSLDRGIDGPHAAGEGSRSSSADVETGESAEMEKVAEQERELFEAPAIASQTQPGSGFEPNAFAIPGRGMRVDQSKASHEVETLPSTDSLGVSTVQGVQGGMVRTDPSSLRPARGKIADGASLQRLRGANSPSASAITDSASSVREMRDGAVVPATRSWISIGTAAGGKPGATTSESFAAMDAGSRVGAPSLVRAGGRSAEAGFEDPSLGWVGVRANLSSGSVHATLIPGTAEAAQVLSAGLTGLTAHLSSERVAVGAMSVESPTGNGLAANVGQGSEQNARNQESQSAAVPASSNRHDLGSRDSNAATSATDSGGNEMGAAFWIDATRGTQISVLA